MASTSETGHAKNVANFDELISFVAAYGPAYNLSKASIQLPALQTLSAHAKTTINAVNGALPAYNSAIAARDAAFAPLNKLTTRVINALKATDTTVQVDESARTLVRKIQGKRATPKMTEAEKQAAAAAAPLSNARIARNEVLYKTNTGLVDIATDTKTYIKSVFGATSPQFKQVSKLAFRAV